MKKNILMALTSVLLMFSALPVQASSAYNPPFDGTWSKWELKNGNTPGYAQCTWIRGRYNKYTWSIEVQVTYTKPYYNNYNGGFAGCIYPGN